MLARVARSIGTSALACLAGTALVVVAVQALAGRWSLHATLDLGGSLAFVATAISAVTCLPLFALLRGGASFGYTWSSPCCRSELKADCADSSRQARSWQWFLLNRFRLAR